MTEVDLPQLSRLCAAIEQTRLIVLDMERRIERLERQNEAARERDSVRDNVEISW